MARVNKYNAYGKTGKNQRKFVICTTMAQEEAAEAAGLIYLGSAPTEKDLIAEMKGGNYTENVTLDKI